MERRFKVTVDGRAYDVTVEDLSPTQSSILPQPGDMKVPEPVPDPDPKQHSPQGAAVTAPASGSVGPAHLSSPLAGVVADIEVHEGETVVAGQKVVVIEAMKMKTAVAAHRPGVVSSLNVQVGHPVDAGQSLMSIE